MEETLSVTQKLAQVLYEVLPLTNEMGQGIAVLLSMLMIATFVVSVSALGAKLIETIN